MDTVKVVADAFFQDLNAFNGFIKITLVPELVQVSTNFVSSLDPQEVNFSRGSCTLNIVPNSQTGEGSYYKIQIVRRQTIGAGHRDTAIFSGVAVVPDHDCNLSDIITVEPVQPEPIEAAKIYASEAKAAAVQSQTYAEQSGASSTSAENYENMANTASTNAMTYAGNAESAKVSAESARDAAILARVASEEAQVLAVSAKDRAVEAETDALAAQASAESARDAALAAQVGAETAQSGAETAAVQSQTYAEQSGASSTSAESARDAALAAQAGAETARSGAETAQSAASAAKDASERARDTAVAAKTSAETASTAAQIAEDGAVSAKDAALAAQVGAETAQSGAETALAGVATAVKKVFDTKQDTLVSGTNIKTVNGTSLLGSGNIEVSTYTLEWPQTTFYITQQATAIITNFDSYTNYNVTALLGTVSIAGDTITYTAPAVVGNEVVSINGVAVASFEVLVAGILAPTINTPLSASTDNLEVVTFDLSDFVVIPTGFDTHVSTTVEVYTDAGMTNLFATVTKTTGDLTLVDVGSHVVSTTYYARAKYSGSVLTSDWSAIRRYTTKDTFSQAYGVDWNPTTDTYSRTGLAVGTANSTSYAGAIQTQMRRCVLNANGTVKYYLHPNDSTKKADGTAATIDGSVGNVMVEIPKFWYKYEHVSGVHKWSISPKVESGYEVHPAFIRGGVEKSFRYYPAYEGHNLDGKLISGSGRVPTVDQTRATFRSYAAANGTGWSLIDWNLLIAVQLLYLTEYATFDTQAMIGNGNNIGNDYTMTTGGSNGIGNASSPSTNNDTWMSYRGIENWYASMFKFIDGVNVQERKYFINSNPATFADDVFTGDYINSGITSVTTNGYVSNLVSNKKGFVASATAGSDATYVPDYFYQSGGNRIVVFGGYAGNGLNAGGFYLDADYFAAYAIGSIGSGVSY